MTTNTKVADVSSLIQILSNCSVICRRLTASSVLDIARDQGLPDVAKLVRLVNDCAASCDIGILLIDRKSHIIIDFLQLCEELTMECAWECSKYNFDICKECSTACEQVAKSCLPFITENESI